MVKVTSFIFRLLIRDWYIYIFKAHFGDTPGVWVHALDNSEVTWFSPKLNCGDYGEGHGTLHYPTNGGGDAYLLTLSKDEPYAMGAWCDYKSVLPQYFICEGII